MEVTDEVFESPGVDRVRPGREPDAHHQGDPRRHARRLTGRERLRIVVALGGNALLRRGQPMTAENQRENVRIAAEALAPVAQQHQLVVSHGNGPQVGLLALQAAAYDEVEPYPLDVLGAQTEGMIGYMIEQELGNLLPFEVPFATLLTMVEVDPDDPAFRTRPSSSARSTTRRRRTGSPPRRAGPSSRTATSGAGWCHRRCPSASSRSGRSTGCSSAARSSSAPAAAASRRCTSRATSDAGRRGGGHRQGPRERAAGARAGGRPVRDGHRRRRASTSTGARPTQRAIGRATPTSCASYAVRRPARWARRSRPPATSSSDRQARGDRGARGSARIVAGEAGTNVTTECGKIEWH